MIDFEDLGIGIESASHFIPQGMAVILLHRIPARNARKNQLSSPAEAGHFMSGNGIDEDDLICLCHAGIDPYVRTPGSHAHMGEHGFIRRNMLVHLNAPGHFLAHAGDIFLIRMRTVSALGKDDVHILIRNAGPVQFIHHMNGEFPLPVPGPGDIGHHEAYLISLFHQFRKRLRPDRMAHHFQSCFLHIAGRSRDPYQYIRNMFLRQQHRLRAPAIRQFEFFKSHFLPPVLLELFYLLYFR